MGEIESVICDCFLSLAVRQLVSTDPSVRFTTSVLLGH